jgi:excisionase family DNA binding protein
MSSDNEIVETTTQHPRSSEGKGKRTYTVYEIAALLQISKSKAYELCKQGYFRTISIGRSVRISKTSFDEWLDSQI